MNNYLTWCMAFRSRLVWQVWNLEIPGAPGMRWDLLMTEQVNPTENEVSPAYGLGRLRYRWQAQSSDPVRSLIRRALVAAEDI